MIEDLLIPLVNPRFVQDGHYRLWHTRVINPPDAEVVMGVRTPDIRSLCRNLYRQGKAEGLIRSFEALPSWSLSHEELMVWGGLVNTLQCPLEQKLDMLGRFVPAIDNWAVCDFFCSGAKWIAKGERSIVWERIKGYFTSLREFEVRFAVVAGMVYFLDEKWRDNVLTAIASIDYENIRSAYSPGQVSGNPPYYVRMAVAWLLSRLLALDAPYAREAIASGNFPKDIVGMYVRKAKDSFVTRNIDPLKAE